MRDSQKKAIKKYSVKCRQVCLRFRKDKDADVLEWMDNQASVTRSIKSLIRASIEEEKNNRET